MSDSQMLEMNQVSPSILEADNLYEVVNGERKEILHMGAFDTVLASEFGFSLTRFVREHKLGLVAHETLFVLDEEGKLKRRPDVAFVSYPRWPAKTVPRQEAWNVVPDLAVEIVSPWNLAEEIVNKIREYFQAGVRLVWVLYPESGHVYAYQSPTKVQILERSEELDGGEVLPGFRLRIEDLFAAITKPE